MSSFNFVKLKWPHLFRWHCSSFCKLTDHKIWWNHFTQFNLRLAALWRSCFGHLWSLIVPLTSNLAQHAPRYSSQSCIFIFIFTPHFASHLVSDYVSVFEFCCFVIPFIAQSSPHIQIFQIIHNSFCLCLHCAQGCVWFMILDLVMSSCILWPVFRLPNLMMCLSPFFCIEVFFGCSLPGFWWSVSVCARGYVLCLNFGLS